MNPFLSEGTLIDGHSVLLSLANDLPSLMEEARLLKLEAQVYQKSGNTEETLKTLTRAKEVQTR